MKATRNTLGGHRRRRFRRMILGHRHEVPCHYCGRMLDAVSMTLDHKVPLCKGGERGMKNIVPSCAECNQRKGDKYYAQFMAEISA